MTMAITNIAISNADEDEDWHVRGLLLHDGIKKPVFAGP